MTTKDKATKRRRRVGTCACGAWVYAPQRVWCSRECNQRAWQRAYRRTPEHRAWFKANMAKPGVRDRYNKRRRELGRTPAQRAAATSRAIASRHDVRGRSCVGCQRTDSEATWGQNVNLCGACERMACRNGRCSCGAPLKWYFGPKRLWCRAGC